MLMSPAGRRTSTAKLVAGAVSSQRAAHLQGMTKEKGRALRGVRGPCWNGLTVYRRRRAAMKPPRPRSAMAPGAGTA
jgi:hypothetical protein